MKIEEFKDYLVDKKDELKNYIVDKKETIKDGAKKAVATGLVVSTLLGGATMMTGCDEELPDDLSQVSYEEVINGLNKLVEKNGVDYSDITICDDIVFDKCMILFAEKDGKKNVYYEISKETFDNLKTLAMALSQDGVEVRNRTISITREAISANPDLKALADEVYSNVKDIKSSEYSLAGRYTAGMFEDWSQNDANEDPITHFELIFNGQNDYRDEVFENDDNYFNSAYCEFYYDNEYVMNVHGYYNSEKDDSNARMHVKHETVFPKLAKEGIWAEMMTYLQEFEDGENIWCEEGRYFVNIDCFVDGKYKILCELIRPLMAGCASHYYYETTEDGESKQVEYDDIYYNQVVGKEYSLFPEEEMTK